MQLRSRLNAHGSTLLAVLLLLALTDVALNQADLVSRKADPSPPPPSKAEVSPSVEKDREEPWGAPIGDIASGVFEIEDPQLPHETERFRAKCKRREDLRDGLLRGEPLHCDARCQEQVEREIEGKREEAKRLIQQCKNSKLDWPDHEDGIIAAIAGFPEDEISSKFKKVEEVKQITSTLLSSIAENTKGQVRVLLVTNPSGVKHLSELWGALANKERIKLFVRVVDIWRLLEMAAEKNKLGLTTPFIFRLWQVPKLWIGMFVPVALKHALVVDLDVVLNADVGLIFQTWKSTLQQQEAKDPQSCLAFGLVPEVGNTVSDHKDFQDVPDRYVNTGVMMLNLVALKETKFHEVLMDVGIYYRSAPRWPNPQGQWPPEQWTFNAIFAHFRELLFPIHRFWNLNCIHRANSHEQQFEQIPYGPEDFARDKKHAFVLHYCGADNLQQFR
mmetsp:Transcript_6094/g.12204  ORF Transcript_6094/g.12204 Transcript_6094/m.12204 type:complete len:445 (-) Transcript_6094:419-1753(-)